MPDHPGDEDENAREAIVDRVTRKELLEKNFAAIKAGKTHLLNPAP